MSDDTIIFKRPTVTPEEIQQDWLDLKTRVAQLEAEHGALQQENKSLKFLVERVIEHRQKSHGELVLLLSGLVSKLPINDVGIIVSKLVEHNNHVNEMCAALAKGKADAPMPQPTLLKAMADTKRELLAALKPAVEELIRLDTPLEKPMLENLITEPESFFTPKSVRATRCFVKGQVTKERILREYGEPALIFFNDLTTDAKLNPRPKPDEIVLAFKNDLEALLQQNAGVLPDKRDALKRLFDRVQRSKAASEQARAQRNLFNRVSFILDLLHYYENQNTEAPDVIFAQRLPALAEQLVIGGAPESLDEKLIVQVEKLLTHVVNPDHRLMVVNNVGKSGGLAKTLKFVLRLRAEKIPDLNQVVAEFVVHLLPQSPQKPAAPKAIADTMRLIPAEHQKFIAKSIMASDRLRKEDAQALGMAIGKELGLTGLEEALKTQPVLSPEMERSLAWEKIKTLITSRADPNAIAAAIRDRLHAKYDADEIKQSWLTLTDVDPIALIRIFCQLPYLADGRTDPVARAAMETYVTRLTHEKYVATYNKILTSLKNMFKANPTSPTLLNFVALVKWIDAGAASKLTGDIGMASA